MLILHNARIRTLNPRQSFVSALAIENGRILMSDRTAAVRASTHPRIRALLDRTPRDDSVDADEYMNRLTREIA